MTDPLHRSHRSISLGNGSSENMPQGMAEDHDPTTLEVTDSPERQPDLALDSQALQILDSSDDSIKVLDLDGRILFISRGGQALLGIQDVKRFLNTPWIDFWQEGDWRSASEAIAKARSGEVCSFQGYRLMLNGEPKWWESKVSPMRGSDGQVERLLCISRDITESRQIEDQRKQAEEKLRESEERYRAIINQAVTGVACGDFDGNLTLVNQKYCDITGYSADELIQRRMQDITHPEDLPRNVELFHRMRAEGTPFEIEKRYIRKDGSIVWVNNSVSVICDSDGKPQSAVAISLDITERKQAELSAAFLATVTQNLAEATCVEEIIQTVGEQLHRYLQVSICAFVEINETAEVAVIDHSWHLEDVPSLVASYYLPEFVTGEFFQASRLGQTIVVRDVATDSRIADAERFAPLKIGSFINVPLIRNGKWKFTLGVYHQTPYNWRNDEIHLMGELANRIWTKLERTRVEIALRQNQEMFSALVADAPFGVHMIDAEFRFRQANQTSVAAFNIGPLIGRDFAEAVRTVWQEPFATEIINRFRHTLATGEPYYSPTSVEPRADIEEIQSYDWQLHRITLSDGSYGVVCYFYDLSEVKRAEEIIRRTGDRDAFRVTLNDALRPLTDAIVIQATANRVLGEYLQTNRVTYFEVRSADYFVERDYVDGVESLQGGYPIESFGPKLLATYRSGQTATSTDVAADPQLSSDQRSAYAAIQIAAYIGVPLVKQGEFVAGLAVHSSTPRHWTSDEIALAEEVAERTWAAVERARAEAALRESEAKYRSLFTSIDEGYNLLEMIVDESGRPVDFRILETNPAWEQQTGLTDATGKTLLEIAPDFEQPWLDFYSDVLVSGRGRRTEYYTASVDRWYTVYASRIGGAGSRQVAVVFNDITEQKQAEQQLRRVAERDAFRVKLSDALRSLADPVDIEETVTQAAMEYFGADRCYYCKIEDGSAIIRRDAAREGLPTVAGVYPLSNFALLQAAFDAGHPFVVQDVHTTDAMDEDLRQLCIQLQVLSYINVPVIKNGKPVSALCLAQSTLRDWSDLEVELAVETADRTWAAVERARAEAAIADDLRDTQLLRDLSVRLTTEESIQALYQGIMATAIALTQADAGTVQILDEATQDLVLLANQGFDPSIIEHFYRVNASHSTSCGTALRSGVRVLIDYDDPATGDLDNSLQLLVEAGYHSAQSTPLITRAGKLIGMVTSHWRTRHQPSDRELRFLDLLARQAADLIEQRQAEAAIAADLRDTQLLRDLSIRLATEESIQALYQEIMAAAITITQADAGTVQILDESTQDLVLLATQGFERTMTDHFYRINASSHTPCGIALRSGIRSFVDFDVPESEDPEGSMRMHVEAGYLSAQSTPLITRTGKPIGMVSTHWHTRHRPSDRELRFLDLLVRQAADLIEQRQTEAQRNQLLEREQAAREEAEQANRIKDEFLAVLSHELRSPLNPILGWSKLLQTGKLDETKTAQALATIERNAKLQSELIEDLLDVSRILRGKLSLNVAPVNLAIKIRGAIETVQLAADAKSIQIEASLAEDVGLVSGDSTRLQQVVWNLLSNAVKFTPAGGRITIRLEPLDASAQITVSDTGQGIAPDFLPYVFDYFRQADGATTRKFGGLGLGLAIVRHLVELHGGTVRADSLGEGQGATFTIQLPLMQTPSPVNQDERSPQQSLNLNGIKILIVDDEPDTRDLVAFVLEQQGAQVVAATSAPEALLLLPQVKPDVLLSDIGMPEMDGFMLIRQIRAKSDEQGGNIVAIALTAYAGDTNQQQVIAAGFQKHISKPIEPEELVQAIVHLIRST